MADKYEFMERELADLKEEGRLINIRTIESPADAWMVVDGKKVLNFCTNNYLGLANHPQIKAAAQRAIEEWGVGPAAVRTIAGTQALHTECEQRIAAFKSVEAALLVQSGFCANQAAIPPLVSQGQRSWSMSTATPLTWKSRSPKTCPATVAGWSSPMACSAWMETLRRWTRFTR
jgi:glycine C-acetyltransferase